MHEGFRGILENLTNSCWETIKNMQKVPAVLTRTSF